MKCLLLLLLIVQVLAFTPFSMKGRGIRTITSRVTMSMVEDKIVNSPKAQVLKYVKDRSEGRDDLDLFFEGDAAEADSETASYDDFQSADSIETNPPKVGETITGTVIEMDDNGALLSITGKMSGYLPLKEASLIPIKHVNMVVNMGDEVTAEVIGTLKGMPVISLRTAQLVTAWEEILKVRADDESFEVKILEVNRGGAVCDAFGLKAFLPGSHYLGVPDESIIGNTVKVKFLDVNESEGKLVISQRRALMENQNTDMTRGEVVSGTVTGLRQYGAFLELDGGIAGLLHISQISYDRIESLESLFTIGQRCKVMILEHDKANGRVALSTKTLEPSPGDMLKDMQSVFDNAEETAKKYHERMESERQAREAAAKDIVAGLGGQVNNAEGDPLTSVADSIESILASIVSDEAPTETPAE
jgi:small subunit ribosomal protein S1